MFQSRPVRATALAVAATLAGAGAAAAHAHLVTSSPAANAAGPAPATIELKLSEAPLAKFSRVQVTTSGHIVPVKTVASADKDMLVVAPRAPLKPGAYSVKWHAVTADTHRSQGAFTFTVR